MMSNRTKEINKITTTIISISVKLIVYALIILLLYEAVVKGYAFGHEIFYAESADPAPGRDVTVLMDNGESVTKAAQVLAKTGLIRSEFAFIFQSEFYDYNTVYPGSYMLNTSMTSKEILQKLNEKPKSEDDAAPVQSGKAKAAGKAASSGDGNKKAEKTQGEAAPQDDKSVEASDSRANQQTYAGEDQETEGGWIEDAPEE